MPVITVLPHPELCPAGLTFDAAPGTTLCDALLDHQVDIDHACGKVGACTTCHVVVRRGGASMAPPADAEEDMLDRAWGVEAGSRLSCQAVLADTDLEVAIPRYSVNQVREG